MPEQDDIARVWDILERHSVGMLATRFPGGLRARPLDARPDRAAGLILFVTDADSHKDDDIEASPDVCFTVIVDSDKAYLSVTGRASVRHDPAKARAIWKTTDDMWWPGGADDANARVLTVAPRTAELWDGPSSSVVAAYEFAKAGLTGEAPDLGENRKKTIRMG